MSDSDEEYIIQVHQLLEKCRRLYERSYPDSPLDFDRLNLTGRVTHKTRAHARGHFADVYKGKVDRRTEVAVKMLRLPTYTPSNERIFQNTILRFVRELSLWSKLNHINITQMLGYTTVKGNLSLISPWHQHGNLVQYLQDHPNANKQDLMLDVAEGTLYLHTCHSSLVHGDLKGANVLVGENSVARLTDFGISKQVDDINRGTGFTTTSGVLGTMPWMAPELNTGSALTFSSDVYSCAGVFLEIACPGKTPYYYIHQPREMILAKDRGELPQRTCYPEMSEQDMLWRLMCECWSRDPGERPDVRTVVETLYKVFRLKPRGPPGDWSTNPRKSVQDNPALSELSALVNGLDLPMLDSGRVGRSSQSTGRVEHVPEELSPTIESRTDTPERSATAKSKSAKGKDIQKMQLLFFPPGLINHAHASFFNGALQSLIATQLLEEAVNFRPTPTLQYPRSPDFMIPARSPALTNGRGGTHQREWRPEMPISDAFLAFMEKAWVARDSKSRVTLSPKNLLLHVGVRHPQYLDFRQQDAHELVRHLLDSMRMEELDVIKKRQSTSKVLPSVVSGGSGGVLVDGSTSVTSGTSLGDTTGQPVSSIHEEERLSPFVDMVFGGKLASILVCEGCKHVSHIYEDFSDLSLPLSLDGLSSKRDHLKQLVQKFVNSLPGHTPPSPILLPSSTGTLPHPPSVAPLPQPVSLPTAIPLPTYSPVSPFSEAFCPHSVPLQRSTPGTSLRLVTEAIPSDGGRSRSAEYYAHAHPDVERSPSLAMSATSNASTVLVGSSLAPSGTEAIFRGPEGLTTEPRAGGPDTKLGGRVPKQFGITVKQKYDVKVKDHIGSREDTSYESDTEIRAGDETYQPEVDETIEQPSSSGLTSFFSFSPSGSRANSPHLSMPANITTASARLAGLEVDRAAVREKEKTQRKMQRMHQKAAYLRAILRDEPSTARGPTNPLRRTTASGAVPLNAAPPFHTATTAPGLTQHDVRNAMGKTPGILERLGQFAAVEALDGEDSFACRHCWKLANPHLVSNRQKTRNIQCDDVNAISSDEGGETDSTSGGSSSSEADEDEPKPNRFNQSYQHDPLVVPLPGSRGVSPLPSVYASVPGVFLGLQRPLPTPPTDTTEALSPYINALNPVDSSSPVASLPDALVDLLQTSSGQTTITKSDEGPSPGPDDRRAIPEHGVSVTSADVSRVLPPRPAVDALRSTRDGVRVIRPRPHTVHTRSTESRGSEADLSSEDSEREEDSASSVATGYDSPVAMTPAQLKGMAQPTSASIPRPTSSQRVIRRRALRRRLIATPPLILIIHLKRFQQVANGPVTAFVNLKKLDEYVPFPEHLDLSSIIAPRREDFGLEKKRSSTRPVVAGTGRLMSQVSGGAEHEGWKFVPDSEGQKPEMKVMYRLYAVVVHMGSMLGGHYVAYTALRSDTASNARGATDTATGPKDQHAEKQPSNPPNGAERQWCFVNDTVVRSADLEEVLKAKAYLCFYERVR